MIHFTANTKILVATRPLDFRKQFDGIIAHCQIELKVEPLSGALFVFTNKAKTMSECWSTLYNLTKMAQVMDKPGLRVHILYEAGIAWVGATINHSELDSVSHAKYDVRFLTAVL